MLDMFRELSIRFGRDKFMVRYEEFQIFLQFGLFTNSNEGEKGWENVLEVEPSTNLEIKMDGTVQPTINWNKAGAAGLLE